MTSKKDTKKEGLVLSKEEQHSIESQRVEVAKLEKFRTEYKKLVEETGFTWVVDANSQLNNIQLGIAKVASKVTP